MGTDTTAVRNRPGAQKRGVTTSAATARTVKIDRSRTGVPPPTVSWGRKEYVSPHLRFQRDKVSCTCGGGKFDLIK
ncbi:hypothetical protein Bpfe_016413, partial [Biomphalaria pfeifferi]